MQHELVAALAEQINAFRDELELWCRSRDTTFCERELVVPPRRPIGIALLGPKNPNVRPQLRI